MIGPFMGYQLAIDLNYSEHLEFSEDEFTMPGPGASAASARCSPTSPDTPPSN